MTETVLDPSFVTYTQLLPQSIPIGLDPTVTVVVTVFVAASITVATLSDGLATYTYPLPILDIGQLNTLAGRNLSKPFAQAVSTEIAKRTSPAVVA